MLQRLFAACIISVIVGAEVFGKGRGKSRSSQFCDELRELRVRSRCIVDLNRVSLFPVSEISCLTYFHFVI